MRVHQEEIFLKVPPEKVREFVVSPERIMDYYPKGLSCGVFEPGERFYCYGKAGVSLIERVPEASDENKIVLRVTSARGLRPPFTVEQIRDQAFFIMLEDWEIFSDGNGGTRLLKSWRNIEKLKLRWLPLAWIVRKTAKAESSKLKSSWDAQAG